MLLHAYWDRIGAGRSWRARCRPAWPAASMTTTALLTVTSIAFALGISSMEGAKHLIRDQAGILAGIAALPKLRTLRPRLGVIADACDPLALHREIAGAMLHADAPALHVYYVDDHFVPCEGARPVPRGRDTKRRCAQPGRADTVVTDYHGRAVCFADGEPSGLAATLPPALDQLRQVIGPAAPVLLGFDRGGSCPVVFRACRGPLAPCTVPPRRYWAAGATAGPPRF